MVHTKLCPDCNEPMHCDDAPTPIFRLGRYEIWRWEPTYTCVDCELEKQRDQEREVYDAGFNEGFERGMKYQDRWGIV